MHTLFILVLIVTVACAQLMPGSTNGVIANGRGGLGRYIRHLEGRDGSSYYGNGNAFGGYYGYAPYLIRHNPIMFATTVILIVLLANSFVAAQLPGTYSGAVSNGRGGLGRYLRHLEHRDQQGYYPYGNEFTQGFYPYGQIAFFG
ncbi:hypothetical protein PRIPAC_78717 [Pristionchus pacificus]|uniref:Uncharacterized protein n=1 Tax=Pristionchus pacificus TaxID=54126 RepID=A0A2A6C3T5_PRIPA|nr:hypothetical protein PRIPAC_78717 [Pristionchus pacificus]|eukprot:PDM72767.1 hypothetical protein PRIPAC_39201 [Pristionchus pacificus]